MKRHAFTILELLVSMAILSLLILVTLAMVNHTGSLYSSTIGKVSAFRESRAAFESLTRRLSQASLNSYFDYVDALGRTRKEVGSSFIPKEYVRQSELHFVTGQADALLSNVAAPGGELRPTHGIFFQAMLGFSSTPSTGDAHLSSLLNAVGYFVEYGSDQSFRPDFLTTMVPAKKRYRLMQMVQSTEALRIYGQPITLANRFDWFTTPLNLVPSPSRPIAENIVVCIFLARNAAGPSITRDDYTYDSKGYLGDNVVETRISRNQLPPLIQVTLVALDESSAVRLDAKYAGTAEALQPGALFMKAPASMESSDSPLIDDLGTLTKFLNDEHLNYRVFTTNVLIRQAKFSGN